MPRSHRQIPEVRAHRQGVQRSLHLFMLDDDPYVFEDDATDPLSEVVSRRHGQDRFLWLARDSAQDD